MRIRTVKPEYWSHPIMARLPERTQLLGLALLNHADDHGYFHADPAIVRGACAPFREDLATIREDLARLSEVGWVDLRDHPSQGQIGYVVNWTKHQKVDHPKASKIEGYFIRENLAKVRDDLALDQGSGIRDQGGEAAPPAPASPIRTRPKDEWKYTQGEPWVRAGNLAGCDIKASNWEKWRGAIDRTGGNHVEFFKVAESLPPDKRWPEKVEAATITPKAPSGAHQGPKWMAWIDGGCIGPEPEADQ